MIKELPSENPTQIKRTLVEKDGKYLVVSTIERPYELKMLDEVMGAVGEIYGDERASKLSKDGDYETMVFNCDVEGEVFDWEEVDFARYSSREYALKGHDLLVKAWEGK